MDFKQTILNLPQQLKSGFELAKDIKIADNTDQIIFCGMGGSALAGDGIKLLKPFLELKTAVKIHKSYDLPDQISGKCLAVISSYSGNTEEALSSYRRAKEKNIKIIAIGSGGKLSRLAKDDQEIFIEIPDKNLPPRLAIGYFLGAILRMFSNSSLIRNIKNEVETASKLNANESEKEGEKLAKFLKNKLILIYSSLKYRPLAYQWKIKFNENSKVLAFTNYFPELNHNEIAGYELTARNKLAIIILNDQNEDKKIIKTIAKTERFLENYPIKFKRLDLKGENELTKLFNSIILADWTTYYLAKLYKVDPVKTQIIEEFKKLTN